MSPTLSNHGFTLVELLVVIAILGAMLGLTIPSFVSFTQNQFLKQGLEQVQSDLRAAQSKSQNGVTDAGGSSVCWGTRIPKSGDTTQYENGYTDCGAGAFVVTNTAKLPGGVTVTSASTTVLFSRTSGQPITTPSIILTLNDVSKNVIVEAGGNIYVQ